MSIPVTIVTVLIVFAILIAAGNPGYQAYRKALSGLLSEQDIAKLPLDPHAVDGHRGQKYTAEIIQDLLLKGFCSPKKVYTGCSQNTRMLFACKATPQSSLWAVLVILFPNWKPRILSGYAIEGRRLDQSALSHGCKVPGLVMP